MQPEIEVLGLGLKAFGLCLALAFAAGGILLARRFRELGWRPDEAAEVLLAALLGGLAGARLYWLGEHAHETAAHPLSSLFGGAGLTWYGGALGGALAVLAWARWRRRWDVRLLAAAAPSLALGYAVGRVGCQLAGDGDYGRPSDLTWAMAYPEGVTPTTVPVQPTPVYETLWMGLVALALWRLRDRVRPATLVGLYLVLAASERFVVEIWRRNPSAALGLTTAQLTSLGIVALGAAVLARSTTRARLRANIR